MDKLELLHSKGFNLNREGLWMRKNKDVTDYIDFRKGNISVYSYSLDGEAVKTSKELKRIRRNLKALDKEQMSFDDLIGGN